MLHLLAKHYHKLPSKLLELDYDELMLNLGVLAEGLRREAQRYQPADNIARSLQEEIDRKRRAMSAKWSGYVA
jgi:hypothetical protein